MPTGTLPQCRHFEDQAIDEKSPETHPAPSQSLRLSCDAELSFTTAGKPCKRNDSADSITGFVERSRSWRLIQLHHAIQDVRKCEKSSSAALPR
jgi:hypothetical protein